MSDRQRHVEMFRGDIVSRIDYHRKENSLSYFEAIGAIEIVLHDLKMELYESENQEEDDETEESRQ
jgi:hypothetical protein